jgi:hypothetical protein
MRAQQVTYSAKPTKEGRNGEPVERGYSVGRMSMPDLGAMRQVKVSMASEVKVAPVRVAASEKGDHTEQQAQDEADEIEKFPRHFIPPNAARRGVLPAPLPLVREPPVPRDEESQANVP